MFMRKGKLALVGAGCALMASSALADPGAYETSVRDRTLRNLRIIHAGDSVPDKVSVRFANCFAAAAVHGFSPEEIEQLNAAVTGGPTNYSLWKKAQDRRNYVYKGNHDLSKLEPYCPADVADFNRYHF
jgi:hypothetical protein